MKKVIVCVVVFLAACSGGLLTAVPKDGGGGQGGVGGTGGSDVQCQFKDGCDGGK